LLCRVGADGLCAAGVPDRDRDRAGYPTARAGCGIATRSVAATAGLEFLPLIWEHFDFVLRHRDYFLPGPQALFSFLRSPALRERALELTGYDVRSTGEVRPLN
jgi:molybdate-binding protein